MSKATRGLRDRRQPGVMELLARARPASLDPPPSPAQEAVTRILAADGQRFQTARAGGQQPQPADRPAQPAAQPATRVAGQARRIRRTVLAGTGLTVTAAAVAVAVLVATAGGGAPTAGHRAQPVLLTAATVRQLAAASRSALATSGRAVVAYRTTQNGALQVTGTDDITFSGKNWNDAFSQALPGPGGRPGHTQSAINRIVNGQFYLYIAGRTARLRWYHDTNPTGHPSFSIPDPRTVLRALAPSARFEVAGYQVIGGMRLKELRATRPGHVAGLGGMLAGVWPGGRVTSLEVWTGGRGVVHRMALTSAQTSLAYPLRADNARRKADGTIILTVPDKAMAAHLSAKLRKAPGQHRVVVRVARHNAGRPHREVAITTFTVTFSGVGQPQHITAPRHAIQQFGHG